MGRLATILVASGLVSGCAAPLFSGPGGTLTMLGATPSSVLIEYTHHYQSEVGAALQTAQNHCAQHGKNAQLAGVTRGANALDRSIATFNCI